MTREEAKNIISQMIKDEEGFLSDNTSAFSPNTHRLHCVFSQ